ncbi:MAG: T9SS type A sorting domain-containing protein, partial [Fluviicola sp.]
GLEGFDPTIPGQEIGTFNLVSSDANFGGSLTQLTTYDVYIYSECAADGLTSDGFFYQFTTKPYCADPTTLAGTTDVDSLNLTWNWIANPGYDISQFNIQYSMEDLNDFTEVIANGTNNSDTVVDASLIPSGVYEVYVQAACLTGDTSNWVGPLSLVMPLENDTTCGAPLLNVDETQYIFNNTGATTSLGENAIAPDATGAQTTDGWINSTINSSLWYRFVAPSTGSVRINSTGRAYDGQIAVYELTNCDDFNTFSLLAANDDEIGGTSKAPNFTVCGLTPGSEYYILFDGFNGTQGEFAIMLKEIVLDAGTANPTAEICTGDDIVLFTTIAGFDNGGTWSSAIPSVNASISDSLFTSTGLAYQTFDFEYRVVDGCAYDTIISQVQIFAPSNAGLDGTITACRNQPINLFSGLNGVVDLFGQWYDPSNNPANENVTTLNFAGNYNYDYIVGNGVCPDDTSNVVVTVTSCNHLSIDEEIFEGVSIHPNPTAGILFIESGIQFDMTITDANGRFVSTNTTSVAIGTTSVDLSTVERGVYFVNLTNGTSSKVYRVIVQ